MNSVSLIAWLIAGVCFIFSLSGLSQHETSRRGNWYGIIGMSIAIIAALFSGNVSFGSWFLLVPAIVAGTLIGGYLATKVEMTAMPELVAILHSFVGLAAVLVGISAYIWPQGSGHAHEAVEAIKNLPAALPDAADAGGKLAQAAVAAVDVDAGAAADAKDAVVETIKSAGHNFIHNVEIIVGVFIGGLTFTGSVVAWGKLDGRFSSKPLMLPGRHWLNIALLVVSLLLAAWFVNIDSVGMGMFPLLLVLLISFGFGIHLVMAIGGADMPVVVSMLNSYSGWAAAATGFMLGNDLLIVVGALVGSSGAILSYIMCHAMNRSFLSVILGGFGTSGGAAVTGETEQLPHTATTTDEVAMLLKDAKEVIVVPGYGMAVAQAQHPIREITEFLKEQGTRTRFAIHPVAGRLPGHMNVLLAEARVPYDLVLEMDEINDDFPETDVVLVIGANDIVNPAAQDDTTSPIYGMPVLEAWKSTNVVVLKRSMGTGYSGVDNPLFYKENTDMLFGDAKASVDGILQNLRA
jgi:NAD(P) transhydrogenase subunit beta